MDNKLLRIATLAGRLTLYLLYASLVLILLACGYAWVSGDTANLPFLSFTESGVTLSTQRAESTVAPPRGLLLFYGLKAILVLSCYLFIIRESLKVVGSIRSLETFRKDNVRAFRRIGHLFVALFLLNLVRVAYPAATAELTFQLEPAYLLGTLAGYLLAEIFREGNHLMEENKLTI